MQADNARHYILRARYGARYRLSLYNALTSYKAQTGEIQINRLDQPFELPPPP